MRVDGGGPRWKSGEKWVMGEGRQVEEEGVLFQNFGFFIIIITYKLKGSFGIFRKNNELRVLKCNLCKLETLFWYFPKCGVFFETLSN